MKRKTAQDGGEKRSRGVNDGSPLEKGRAVFYYVGARSRNHARSLNADTPRDRWQGLGKRTDGKERAKGSTSNHRAIKDSVKDSPVDNLHHSI